ncbi:hypothetical protein E1A91_A01G248700v1 [Gossypium mustelinum]|uniref:Leucine-rich repeat-containing N-terminal plant-type domain-containing protein n=1 Tax=Gossypium mustelinum TaxID=34275 RepID=A0A5D3AJL8_GOSMU|nr:hypothetical protein E1A91_A01G248700v1 [Gossypium mustelinum]
MRMSLFSLLFLNSFVLVMLIVDVVLVSAQCQNDQSRLLRQLESSFSYNPTSSGKPVPLKWNQSTDCCFWDGVHCDGDGHVISLDLNSRSISSSIDNSSSLFRLQHLQWLNLAYNKFKPVFPTVFDKLENLSYLNLSNAGFKGKIPIEISRLTRLVTLDLSVSSLLGRSLKLEKPNLEMLVQNLKRLRFLYLDGVNISATGNEWCKALLPLTELQELSMSYCYLSGPILSSLSSLRSLSVIRLDNNNLSASVPQFFTEFENLTSLRLTATGLRGRVPEDIFQIRTLQILDLSTNKLLEGSFPNFPLNASLQTLTLSGTNFRGQVPESIGNLEQLTRIELVGCNFSEAIPKTMKNLTQLVYLDFSFNHFSGPIPPFSSSRNLTQLSLAHNQLKGTIDSTNWSGLSKLVSIDLQNNMLSGTIPPNLFCIPSLRRLFLSQNQFKGNLGDLHCRASSLLDTFDLSSNKLQGQFPMSVFELRGLKFLSLSSNNFSGLIPMRALQNLKNLSSLDLSYNSLSIDATDTNVSSLSFPNITTLKLISCNLTEFPDFLTYQSRLSYLDLSNNQIQGKIPNWIWKVRSLRYLNLSKNFLVKFERSLENINSSLNVLDLHGNRLQGKIEILPSSATYLDYSNNNFNSVLPAQIGDFLQFAYFFSVSGNNFKGSIPKSICSSLYLRVLDMSDNYLSGPIPKCLTRMSASLGVLNLRGNNLSGIISDTFPESCKLQTLDLNQNRLEGKVPESLGNCKKLEVVNIGNNQISGSFPCHLKNISKLRILVLRSNKFNGSIHCHKNNIGWPMLQIVDLASNNFSGKLHQKCLELELVKILTVFTTIDISCNNFEGRIPEVIGTFKELYGLNFSHNAFTGSMPSFLGNLQQLESLDLSSNYLSGGIPLQLVNLNFLSFLNVSNNKLFGQIPTGTQLQTFSKASFENNPGLCGAPLTVKCANVFRPTTHTVPELQSVDGLDWLFIFLGVGFGAGAAAFAVPLLLWKTASKWVDGNVDKILEIILPKVGLTYTRPSDLKVEADENPEEDKTEIYDDDEEDEDEESKETTEEFCGRYCVFCSKLDNNTMKKVIHDLCCTCYDSPYLSPSTSTSSSFSP